MASRPYGIGAYGTGPYSRYGGNLYEMQGRTGIVFDAASICFGITWHAEAITGIVFQADASLVLSWDAWAPCATGGWLTPIPCSGGAWQAPGVCGTGTWTVTRFP